MTVHQLPVDGALRSLRSAPDGLSAEEAARRLEAFGRNHLERAARTPIAVQCAREFTHVFAIVLWIAAALAFVAELGDPGHGMRTLALAIVAVILVNGLFSFWQVYRAEEAFLALQQLLPSEVTVVRDGRASRVAAEMLVPGDVVHVEAGDSIAADCRVLEAFALRVDTSAVTGESHPVAKDALADEHDGVLRSRNALLAGTSVVSGNARALVLATGMRTEFGRIATLAQATPDAPSPLQIEISRLSHVITVLAVGAGVLVFVIGESLGLSRWANLVFAVGIIVANVPEGLLPTLTLALAMASRRMARRNMLVRRLTRVETLGASTVICTDKTGTLTENRMAVRLVAVVGRVFENGEWEVEPHAGVLHVLEGARRCHDLKDAGRGPARWLGDPMEVALVALGEHASIADAAKVHEIPFDSGRKRLVTVHRVREGYILHAKGALEMVLPSCRFVTDARGERPITADDTRALEEAQSRMAARGLRVLAFAHRRMAALPEAARFEEDLALDGLVGLEDPPRPEVAAAVARCRAAGIRVVMVTGDHPGTAVAIGREIGLYGAEPPEIVTGERLARLSDAQLWAVLEAPQVLFARMGPEQKLRIVRTLQRHRAIVAATGDGVNDAPALRAADIGIAMGATGTDVARQAADMVLLDDNFASIVSAIEEGRTVYDNMSKFLTYILTSNVPELVPYVAFAFLGWPLALTVPQILAVDLGTDLVPALGLGAERAEPGVMDRPPRSREARVITPALLARAYLFLGLFEAVAAMTAFAIVLPRAGYTAATTACLAAIVVMQVANVLACRNARSSLLASGGRWNALIAAGIAIELVLMVAIAYTPLGHRLFGTAPVAAGAWLIALPFAAAMLVAEETRKWIVRRFTRPAARSGAQPTPHAPEPPQAPVRAPA